MGSNTSKSFTDRDTVVKDKKDLDDIYQSLVKSLNDFVRETGYSNGFDQQTQELVEVSDRKSVCSNFGLFEDRFSKWSEEELRVFGQKVGLKVMNGEQTLDKEGICGTLFVYVQDRAEFNKKVISSLYDTEKSFCLYSSLASAPEGGTDNISQEEESKNERDVYYDKVYRLYRDLKRQTKTNQEVQSKSGKTGPVGPLSTTSITNLDSAFSQLVSKRKSFISFLKNIADKLGGSTYITSRELQKLKADFETKRKDFGEFCSNFRNYLDNGATGLIQRDPNDISTNVPEYSTFRQKV